MRRRSLLALLLAGSVALMSACGGGDPTPLSKEETEAKLKAVIEAAAKGKAQVKPAGASKSTGASKKK